VARKKKAASDFRAPEPITDAHDLTRFDCGQPSLNDWLRRRALSNETSGGSRTYIVCGTSTQRVVAYYCLAAGAVVNAAAPGRVRRNMPDPIPVMVIGRLAVDKRFHRRGLGQALLRDAIVRTLQAAHIAGIRAILVHALSPNAKTFYEQAGFRPSPVNPMTLMITVAEAERALS
jgi:GNAT superfamily N-acetyltransferase